MSTSELWTDEEKTSFIRFLAEKSKNAKSPLIINQLCREYKQKSGSSRTLGSLQKRVSRIQIHELWDFDIDMKVQMAFALGVPIGNLLLEELQREAYLELDDQNRIISYKKKENSDKNSLLLENANITVNGTNLVLGNYRTKKENEELIKFIAEKSTQTKLLFNISKLSREFIEKIGSSRTPNSLNHQIYYFHPIISKLDNFDTETKVRMLFSLSASVDQEYLNELRKIAVVEVDDKQRITTFIANDGSLELYNSRTAKIKRSLNQPCFNDHLSKNQRMKEEHWKLINFIGEKSKIAKSPLNIHQLSTEFIMKIGSPRTFHSVNIKIHNLRQQIADRLDFSTQTEVRLAFALSIPVDKKYINILQENAIVEVDESQRITKYEANNGSLKLEGVHKAVQNIEMIITTDNNTNKRKDEYNIEYATQKPSSSKKYKLMKSRNAIYDGPGEPIPAELPMKKEPNFYDALFWQEEEYKPDIMDLLETSVPEQSEVKLEPIEYQEQIVDWEEQEYKPDIRNLLENPITDQSELKLEPIEYREQIGSWQEEQYKPNLLEFVNMDHNTGDIPSYCAEFQELEFLENNLLDRSVKKEEPEIGYDSQFAPLNSYSSTPTFPDFSQ